MTLPMIMMKTIWMMWIATTEMTPIHPDAPELCDPIGIDEKLLTVSLMDQMPLMQPFGTETKMEIDSVTLPYQRLLVSNQMGTS